MFNFGPNDPEAIEFFEFDESLRIKFKNKKKLIKNKKKKLKKFIYNNFKNNNNISK
jgi:hypothetical protein